MNGSRFKLTFLFVLFCIGVISIIIYCLLVSRLNCTLDVDQFKGAHRNAPKTILLWNAFFGDKLWGLPKSTLNENFFREKNCPVTNCVITSEKDYHASVEYFDALVFHTAEAFLLNLDLPPTRRHPSQLYVFAQLESPAETKHSLADEGGFYNLTMTYRLDSDILWPYAFIKEVETGALVAPNLNAAWKQPPENFHDEALLERVKAKRKLGAWFVSHCDALAPRSQVVQSLQKHMQIDVFGKCGNFSCPRFSSACDDLLDRDYKFYFALENSQCTDYVTEKYFNALGRELIPVVFGGANYTRFAPPKSYISVEDFRTAEDLAKYLIFLDENPEEYIKYFWWKKHYEVTSRSPFCDLCAKLNEPKRRTKTRMYKDIEEWWFGGNNCYFQPRIKF